MKGAEHEDPYHYNPYHHPQPPKTKAEAEQHLGPEAAYFYKEMHDRQQKPQQQSQKQQQQPQQRQAPKPQ